MARTTPECRRSTDQVRELNYALSPDRYVGNEEAHVSSSTGSNVSMTSTCVRNESKWRRKIDKFSPARGSAMKEPRSGGPAW